MQMILPLLPTIAGDVTSLISWIGSIRSAAQQTGEWTPTMETAFRNALVACAHDPEQLLDRGSLAVAMTQRTSISISNPLNLVPAPAPEAPATAPAPAVPVAAPIPAPAPAAPVVADPPAASTSSSSPATPAPADPPASPTPAAPAAPVPAAPPATPTPESPLAE